MTGDILYNLCKRLLNKTRCINSISKCRRSLYAPANFCTQHKQTQRGWIENIKTLGKAGKGIVKI
jgi:hypothetical protein